MFRMSAGSVPRGGAAVWGRTKGKRQFAILPRAVCAGSERNGNRPVWKVARIAIATSVGAPNSCHRFWDRAVQQAGFLGRWFGSGPERTRNGRFWVARTVCCNAETRLALDVSDECGERSTRRGCRLGTNKWEAPVRDTPTSSMCRFRTERESTGLEGCQDCDSYLCGGTEFLSQILGSCRSASGFLREVVRKRSRADTKRSVLGGPNGLL